MVWVGELGWVVLVPGNLVRFPGTFRLLYSYLRASRGLSLEAFNAG